jgi:hypothetical protein
MQVYIDRNCHELEPWAAVRSSEIGQGFCGGPLPLQPVHGMNLIDIAEKNISSLCGQSNGPGPSTPGSRAPSSCRPNSSRALALGMGISSHRTSRRMVRSGSKGCWMLATTPTPCQKS